MIRKIFVLVFALLFVTIASAATVNVTRAPMVRPQAFDQARYLERVGNPTAQEIVDFNSGTLDLIRFTSTAPILEAAETDLDACEQAITLVCGTLSETPLGCRVDPAVLCAGHCANGIRIEILD